MDSVRVDPPTYYTLTIASGNGGSTNPSPSVYEDTLEGTPVGVTANPSSGYVFDYWLLDGQNTGTQNPITVTMNSDHTLQANFREESSYWLTADAYADYYYNEVYPEVYVNGDWAGTAPVSVQVAGWTHIKVDEWIYNEYLCCYDRFSYYSGDFGYFYDNPTDVYVNADKSITAWYQPFAK